MLVWDGDMDVNDDENNTVCVCGSSQSPGTIYGEYFCESIPSELSTSVYYPRISGSRRHLKSNFSVSRPLRN